MQTESIFTRGPSASRMLPSTTSTAGDSDVRAKAGAGSEDLQTVFLRLLVAQMQNQDPTSPMDSSQMTSQLAQINTVSGIAELNVQLSALSAQLMAGQQTEAALLIGSTVLAPGNTTTVSDGKSSGFGVELDHDVDDLEVVVRDDGGHVVDTLHLGRQQAGTVPISWEAKGKDGEPLPDGKYTVTATSTTSNRQTNERTLAAAEVHGVVRRPDGTVGMVLSSGVIVGLDELAAIV